VRVHAIRIEDGGVWIKRPEPGLPPPGDAEPGDDPEWLDWDPERYFKKR
jgi:hypothetical protein